VTLQLNGSTEYVQGKTKTPIALSDLKVGDHVGVVFGASGFFKAPGFNAATATFTAKRVRDRGTKAASPAADASSVATTSS
jgi:outer membrane receptor for ferric coprogen and ferric-rhodotorulic acid